MCTKNSLNVYILRNHRHIKTKISVNTDILVTITNEMEMTETNVKTDANYDAKGIYVISSSH